MTYCTYKLAGLALAPECHIMPDASFGSLKNAIKWMKLEHDGLNFSYISAGSGDKFIIGMTPAGKQFKTEEHDRIVQPYEYY